MVWILMVMSKRVDWGTFAYVTQVVLFWWYELGSGLVVLKEVRLMVWTSTCMIWLCPKLISLYVSFLEIVVMEKVYGIGDVMKGKSDFYSKEYTTHF